MAFQPINYANIAPLGLSGIRDIVSNLSEGYKAGRLPYELQQKEKQQDLVNSLKEFQLKSAPGKDQRAVNSFNQNTQIRDAQIKNLQESMAKNQALKSLSENKDSPFQQQALQAYLGLKDPAQPKMGAFAQALQDKQGVIQQFGPDSQEAKLVDQNLQRMAAGSGGTELSVDPATGAITYSQGRSRGAPANQVINGQVVSKPTQATSSAQQKTALANFTRERIAPLFEKTYSGIFPSLAVGKDALNYLMEEDPGKKQELEDDLVDFAVSTRLAPEYAGLQLQAQGTPATVPSLEHQTKALTQGWPAQYQSIANSLPEKIQKRAAKKHDAIIKDLNRARQGFFAKGMPFDINATTEPENKVDSPRASSKPFTKVLGDATYEKRDGKWYKLQK